MLNDCPRVHICSSVCIYMYFVCSVRLMSRKILRKINILKILVSFYYFSNGLLLHGGAYPVKLLRRFCISGIWGCFCKECSYIQDESFFDETQTHKHTYTRACIHKPNYIHTQRGKIVHFLNDNNSSVEVSFLLCFFFLEKKKKT